MLLNSGVLEDMRSSATNLGRRGAPQGCHASIAYELGHLHTRVFLNRRLTLLADSVQNELPALAEREGPPPNEQTSTKLAKVFLSDGQRKRNMAET